ncbi:MAG: UDP-galactopyranose mutase, partial [Bryobacterales bacterium]|nr:UDP-galactopyranose mutase [Bryobacterales bacterium]
MEQQAGKKALIIGAGPAGLTAAFELLERSQVQPIVLEKSDAFGGISRTVRYKGNRMDIGGHRFFSKSDRVMNWWKRVMPVEGEAHSIAYQGKTREVAGSGPIDSSREDRVMLVRNRKSRIYFLRQFFDYPIQLTGDTLKKLGAMRTVRIGTSYMAAMARQIKPELSLEQFLINRFGRELYLTFFKSYTEKVWGVPCDEISAEWGAQRIKGLSITKAISHFVKKAFAGKPSGDISQKGVETSLIEKFLYPKYGPGQLWEYVAEDVSQRGAVVRQGLNVVKLHTEGFRILAIDAMDQATGVIERIEADYFFSTMPMKELVAALDCEVPSSVRAIAEGLIYRDFITVGVLLKKLKIREDSA